ncbi:MAG: D-alanyl-D-alanine carboxypeptidase family protein, partial [Clostridia bacterium]
ALETMFAAATRDGIELAGVSAYRSHETQKQLFDRYVKKDGEKAARTYSAVPGHSEHETGLAIDVSGIKGVCAAEDCFADTPEASWLAQHAHEYGFIIRYPKGKEAITGYQYEPWHLRFVGAAVAKEINKSGLTMEEFYNAIPVNQAVPPKK